MLSVETFRSQRVIDVLLGHLIVVIPFSDGNHFGIRVEAPDEEAYRGKPTVLDLSSAQIRVVDDDCCLDCGVAPIFVWDADLASFKANVAAGKVGHLVVLNDCVAISAAYRRAYENNARAYWSITSGKLVQKANCANYIMQWQMGLRGVSGGFVVLQTFPPAPAHSP